MLEKGLGITAEAEKSISCEREMEKAIATVDRGEAQRHEQVVGIALEAACCCRSRLILIRSR